MVIIPVRPHPLDRPGIKCAQQSIREIDTNNAIYIQRGQNSTRDIRPDPEVELCAREGHRLTIAIISVCQFLGSPWLSSHLVYSRLAAILLAISFIPGVRADGGDDFANNLFSDLAPLLALFGEQVAKQFLSEASGWADDILFAMAPLGIITAIVSAIRVAGPLWLKAVIGRGREGQAQVELELMSSNSTDVGEMWNDQAIVRVFGTPTIFQLIYSPVTAESGSPLSIAILNDANPFFERRQKIQASAQPAQRDLWNENFELDMRQSLVESGDRLYRDSTNGTNPPNISLNAKGEPVGSFEKWLMATVGIVVQLMVLAYQAIISFYPTWKREFLKGGNPPSSQSFPCAVIGTVLLTGGMLLCSYVIDSASTEVDWILRGDRTCRVAWIQRGGTVNDQYFAPYLIFGHEGQKSMTTSHRCNQAIGTKLRSIVLLATITSMVGFVLQFIGLRGMHWSASIVQLAATVLMTMIRSLVRRRMMKEPNTTMAIEGHELDSMAREIGECSEWKLVLDFPSSPDSPGSLEYSPPGLATNVMFTRARLGELSKWSSEIDGAVDLLCITIEKTINCIEQSNEIHCQEHYPPMEKDLTWMLTAVAFGSKPPRNCHCEQLEFNLKRRWAGWRVSEDSKSQLVAVLSLWVMSFTEEENFYRTGNIVSVMRDQVETVTMANVLPFLQHAADEQLFKLWMSGQDEHIYWEYPRTASERHNIPIHRFFGQLGHSEIPENRPAIEISTNGSVPQRFAQLIYSEFLSQVIPKINYIDGQATASLDLDEFKILEVRNSTISQLAENISETGLGTTGEILTSLFLNLAKNSLLPLVTTCSERATKVHGIQRMITREKEGQTTDSILRYFHLSEEHRGLFEESNRFEAWSLTQMTELAQKLYLVDTNDIELANSPLTGDLCSSFDPELMLVKESISNFDESWRMDSLLIAAENGYPAVVQSLMSSGMNVWVPTTNHPCPLMIAASRGHAGVVQLILHQHLLHDLNDFFYFQKDGLPFLLWSAAQAGHTANVRLLLEHTRASSRQDHAEAVLVLAAGGGHSDIVCELLEGREYHTFVYQENISEAHWLVWYIEPHTVERTPRDATESYRNYAQHFFSSNDLDLIYRSEHNSEFEKVLCKQTALETAAGAGHEKIVHQLLTARPDSGIGEPGEAALLAAARGRHLQTIYRLLKAGINVNAAPPRYKGQTALQAAAVNGHLAAVNMLLKEGANPNAAPAIDGRTALQAAADGGYLEIVELLLNAKAMVNENYSGQTALQMAIKKGHSTIVDLLQRSQGAPSSVK